MEGMAGMPYTTLAINISTTIIPTLSGVMPGRTRRGFPVDQRGVEDDVCGSREIGCGVGGRGFG